MRIDINMQGLEDLIRRLHQVDGKHQIPMHDVFTDEFMVTNTDFTSFQSMIDSSGFEITSPETFAAIPQQAWNNFIQERTMFESWDAMKAAAGKMWISRQLGIG